MALDDQIDMDFVGQFIPPGGQYVGLTAVVNFLQPDGSYEFKTWSDCENVGMQVGMLEMAKMRLMANNYQHWFNQSADDDDDG